MFMKFSGLTYSKIKKPNSTLLDDQYEVMNTLINVLRIMSASGF